ncbi:MAG TPA: hypothetical protein DCZ94_17375 [Lentisphaeria bacterium]|nr:MAG: hypothetical protein A2X48_20805 [Lentisphaerae bacterium GWF2_49_21]HBC88715.1 hypothetical protein [Lentisphaeria bacterium]
MGNNLPSKTISALLESDSRLAAKNGILHGLVVAAGRNDSLDVHWSWGSASVHPNAAPMRKNSIFDVASITKAVATTSAYGVCIDNGLLDPDSPVSRYLPGIGEFEGSSIQVRDLATHCSGYDNHKFTSSEPDQLVHDAVTAPPQWPHRERFVYSCRNFIVLGHLVEKLSGEDLPSFCRQHLFDPLVMKDTRFGPVLSELDRVVPTQVPAGTIADEQARKVAHAIGNAGLFSTAGDLSLFCRMILSGGWSGNLQILKDETLQWLMKECSPHRLPRRSFGWDMRSCSECTQRPTGLSDSAIGHGGWTGHSLWIDPVLNAYIIILTNRTHMPGNPENYESSMLFRARIGGILISPMTGTLGSHPALSTN